MILGMGIVISTAVLKGKVHKFSNRVVNKTHLADRAGQILVQLVDRGKVVLEVRNFSISIWTYTKLPTYLCFPFGHVVGLCR